MDSIYRAGVESGLFYAGVLAGKYGLETTFRRGAFGILSFTGQISDLNELEKDYAIYAEQRSPEDGKAFDAKYGPWIRLACEVAEFASHIFPVAFASALPGIVLSSEGSSMKKMAVIGLVSMVSAVFTVPPVRNLAISAGEKFSGTELRSDFAAYQSETSPEKKQKAADRFIEKHGSALFFAIRATGMACALATTFAVDLLARSVSAR